MNKTAYSLVIMGGLLLGGCTLPQMINLAKQQNLTVTPNPLEVHKDTVALELGATLPVKMLKPGSIYTLNTFYKASDKEVALDPVQFKSDDFPQSSTVQIGRAHV